MLLPPDRPGCTSFLLTTSDQDECDRLALSPYRRWSTDRGGTADVRRRGPPAVPRVGSSATSIRGRSTNAPPHGAPTGDDHPTRPAPPIARSGTSSSSAGSRLRHVGQELMLPAPASEIHEWSTF